MLFTLLDNIFPFQEDITEDKQFKRKEHTHTYTPNGAWNTAA